jgi:hypothetical protein
MATMQRARSSIWQFAVIKRVRCSMSVRDVTPEHLIRVARQDVVGS